jgi:CubicO group peptidase (beta-lactamase class C family)
MTGLSKPRLERLHQALSGYVERHEMPGMVALVSHHDDVHVETLGAMSLGHPAPMRRDAIFRIASLAKPMTAVAAMILVEDCKLRLDESIEPWLPELAHRRVLKSISSQLDDTVPARRAISVRDLLTFRMGFGSVATAGTCARHRGMAAEARLAAVDGAAGRALAISHELRCARRADCAGVGTILGQVHAAAHL